MCAKMSAIAAICFNLAESEQCTICADPKRDQGLLCVVEQPRDLMSLEAAGVYRGLYHVLLGRIAPFDGVGPDQLTLEALVKRVAGGQFREVIMATNPTVEGDGTALHISNLLSEFPVAITRLARGITTGSILEFTNKEILADATEWPPEVLVLSGCGVRLAACHGLEL